MSRKLRVFLCHATEDRSAARELYMQLAAEPWIQPWMDTEDLLPGQDFDLEIYKTLRDSDAILICMSQTSVTKSGYLNKEIRRALDAADEKPEGSIYIIPVKFDDCIPSFERLKKYQWLEYFAPNAHERLVKSLRMRAEVLKIETSGPVVQSKIAAFTQDLDFDLYRFIQIPVTPEIPYSFYIGKYPVTNAQYERFLNAPDYSEAAIWRGFLKFNEDCIQIGRWHEEGWDWFQEQMKDPKKFLDKKRIIPRYWDDQNFGISNPENPVVGITWYESNAYCNWLMRHWNEVTESKANPSLHPQLIRLPLDTEWTIAAGGEASENRFPWDMAKKTTRDIKEIVKRANISESGIGHTTPVNAYLRGASPHAIMDMAGNVWEWQANYRNLKEGWLGLRGGSWLHHVVSARVAIRYYRHPGGTNISFGFRVWARPSG